MPLYRIIEKHDFIRVDYIDFFMTKKRAHDIAIITLHCVNNFGSILQTIGLFMFLKKNNLDPIVIDYIPPQLTINKLAANTKKKWPLKGLVYIIKYFKHFRFRVYNYKFIRKHTHLTRRKYYSNEELINNPPKANIFVTGSDQVWNSGHNRGTDRAFFLDFVPSHCKRISYAASFGKSELEKDEERLTQKMLLRFDKISVREKEGVSIVENLGIKSPVRLVDPVLLLKKEDWYYLARGKAKESNYLLIYEVNNENLDILIEYSLRIASTLGLKTYFIKTTQKLVSLRKVDRILKNISPNEFLYYFKNASYIVTGSFHGTAFSLLFNKKFIVVPPLKYSTRLSSLLALFNLSERAFKNEFSPSIAVKEIDFIAVNIILERERERAREYFCDLTDANFSYSKYSKLMGL